MCFPALLLSMKCSIPLPAPPGSFSWCSYSPPDLLGCLPQAKPRHKALARVEIVKTPEKTKKSHVGFALKPCFLLFAWFIWKIPGVRAWYQTASKINPNYFCCAQGAAPALCQPSCLFCAHPSEVGAWVWICLDPSSDTNIAVQIPGLKHFTTNIWILPAAFRAECVSGNNEIFFNLRVESFVWIIHSIQFWHF